MTPPVTAVIPTTLRRPSLLRRALASVRAQDGATTEIVVVVDATRSTPLPDLGPDVRVVRTVDGPRGPGSARNRGVDMASHDLVAFLDDDDIWAPEKLRRQIQAARAHEDEVIVGSAFNLVRNGRALGCVPRRSPEPGEDVGEWAYCQRLPFGRTGWANASSILAPRDLLVRCPFADEPNWEDVDWLLRVTRRHGARYVHLADALVDVFVEDDRPHRGAARTTWRDVADWVEANPDLFTPASAAAVLLTVAARHPGGRRAYPTLVRSAFGRGRPRPVDLLASAAMVLVPPTTLRAVSRALAHRTGGS